MTEKQIDEMVDRFLRWELPADFRPDGGIKFTPPHEIYSLVENPDDLWPVGTNLFTADQAKAMIKHMLGQSA
jgi:hypothetical protein